MHIDAVAEHLSSGHKTAFSVVCGIISLCSIVGNVFYLYCYIRDSQLKCCFHLLVANIAVSDILFSVTMVSLNILVLYKTDVIACAVYRTLIFLLRQEVKILLVLISVDRIHIIKDIMKYRQSTKKRTRVITVISWLASTAVAALYGSFMFAIHGDSVPSDYNHVEAHHCHGFHTVYLDFNHLVQLVMDVLILGMYGYVLMLCRKTQHAISSMHLLIDRHSPDESQPQPREDAAYNLNKYGDLCMFDRSDGDYMPHNLEVIPEASGEHSGCLPSTSKSLASHEDDNYPANTRGISQDGNAHQDKGRKQARELFATSSASASKKTSGVEKVRAPQGSHKDSPDSPNTPTRPGEDGWPHHPMTKSLMHALLAKPTASGLWRSDAMAAQQLGVFLCLHILLSAPSNFANFIASVVKVDMTGFVHWLDFLTLLRGAVFPLIYCLYSCRLRGHLDPRLCPCCLTKVTPSQPSAPSPLRECRYC